MVNSKKKSYFLNIADYNILLDSDLNIELQLAPIYKNFISDSKNAADIKITLKKGIPIFNFITASKLSADVSRFSTPEISQKNWQVFEKNLDFYVTIFSENEPLRIEYILHISKNKNWQLYFHESLVINKTLTLFSHPLGSLIIYYCSVLHNDIFMHGSGTFDGEKGRIFSGFSGSGKTTMAQIWKQNGSTVVHDDRLILRKKNANWFMHNTPVYLTDYPKVAPVHEIYFLNHSLENNIKKIKGSGAVAKVLSCCIQHAFNKSIIENLIESVSDLSKNASINMLGFYPDKNIMDFIKTQ